MFRSASALQFLKAAVVCGLVLASMPSSAVGQDAEMSLQDRNWHFSITRFWTRNNLAAPDASAPVELRLSGAPICVEPPQTPCRDIAKTDEISTAASQWWARFDHDAFLDLKESASSEDQSILIDQYLAYAYAIQAEAIALEEQGVPETQTAQGILRYSILTLAIDHIQLNQKITQQGGWQEDILKTLLEKGEIYQWIFLTHEHRLYQVIGARLAGACALYTRMMRDSLCDSLIRYDDTMVASFERYTKNARENVQQSVEELRNIKEALADADLSQTDRRYWEEIVLGTSYFPMVTGLYDITETDVDLYDHRIDTIENFDARPRQETDRWIRAEEAQYGDLEKYWKVKNGTWPDRSDALIAKE